MLLRIKQILFLIVIIIFSYDVSSALSTISGFVRDSNGNPVDNVDLDLIDSQTGVKLITLGDNTDITGWYSITVLNSTFYRVTFAPRIGSGLLGKQVFDFDLTTSQRLDVTLENGIAISGVVSDFLGNPIGEVDLDVDSINGGRVFTPNDNTFIINGFYEVVVPPGLFRIRYDSPLNSRFKGVQLDTVLITNDTIINITMLPTNLLSGTVTDINSLPIFDVDIDLRDAITGAKVFTSNNSTDTLGNYNVAVDPGFYQLRFAPKRGSRYIGVLIDSFNFVADSVYNEVLDEGIVCTIRIVDTLGNPITKADVDFKLPNNGIKIFTPNDKTNTEGESIVTVPQGLYDLKFDPPLGSDFKQILIPNVTISQDTLIELVMFQTPRINFSGQVVDSFGLGIRNVELSMVTYNLNYKINLFNNFTDSLGFFNFFVPQGNFDISFLPQRGSHYIAKKFLQTTFSVDSSAGQITLDEGLLTLFTIVDDLDQTIQFSEIEIIDAVTSSKLFTPYAITDISGKGEAVLPSGMYHIKVNPPQETNLRTGQYSNILVQEDSNFTFKLFTRPTSSNGNNFILQQNFPNPFNSTTTINFEILQRTDVQLDIFNILGQKVKRLTSKIYTPGEYAIHWDGNNEQSEKVATGLYIYRIITSMGSDSRKIVLLK